MIVKKYLKTILQFLSLLFFCLFFSACSFFSVPVNDFFKEYTENAAIESIVGLEALNKDKEGIYCVPGNKDGEFTFYLRNPQSYTLNFDYVFDDLTGYFTGADKIIFSQSSDKYSGTITFPKDEVTRLDVSADNNKNISGRITITEPKTNRTFKSYPIELHANSTPPGIEKAAFMCTTADVGDTNAEYVVAFYAPKFDNPSSNTKSVHFNDTRRFIVTLNGTTTTYYFKDGDSTTLYASYSEDPATGTKNYSEPVPLTLFTTSPGTLYGLTQGGQTISFDSSNTPEARSDGVTYTAFYLLTGIKPDDRETSVTFTFKDDAGLSSSAKISNKAKKLIPPVMVKDDSNPPVEATIFTADEDSGYYSYKITHNGKTTDDSDCGSVYINYRLKNDSDIVVSEGKAYGSANLKLTPGKYKLSTWASKDNFVTSDTKYVNDVSTTVITVHRSANYYVSATGSDDDGLGSRASPYATIKKALEAIEANTDIATPAADATAVTAEIRLLSDITLAEKITYSTQKKVLITGADGYGRTINGNNGLIFATKADGNTKYITFKNLTMTGGKGSTGSIIGMNKTNVVFDNCTITGNTITVNGSATIMSISDSNATFKNCTVKNNTMAKLNTGFNGALYYYRNDSTLYKLCFEGKNYFYDNFEKYDGKSKSSNVCVNNSSKNNYIYFSGSIEGSKIGVRMTGTSFKPGIGSPTNFTNSYSTYNTADPGTIFVSDDGYNIGWNAAKTNAAFYVSSSNPVIATNDDIEIRSLTSVISKPAECGASGRTVKFNAYNKSTGEDVTSKATWKFTPKVMNTALPSGYYSVSGNSIIFESTIGYGTLTVQVEAVVDGTKYSTSHDIEVVDLPVMSQYVSYPAAGTTVAISSAADLEKLKALSKTSVSTKITVVLTNDISIKNWDYIGKSDDTYTFFNGTFDGNGHSITISESNTFVGLFYRTKNDSIIKNLTIRGDISTVSSNSIDTVGVFVANPNSSTITLINCVNKANLNVQFATVNSSQACGGFIGQGNTGYTIKNCRNEGNISSNCSQVGGIAGNYSGNCKLTNCINTGTITSTSSSGYAAGIVAQGNITAVNCINRGVVSGLFAGGVVGFGCQAENCINYGTVTGSSRAGGIGAFKSTNTYQNNVNAGAVTCSGSNKPGEILCLDNGTGTPKNNFYLNNDNKELRGLGNNASYVKTKFSAFTCDGITSTTTESLTVNSVASTDVVKLLNAWIDSQATPSDYVKWTYGSDGLPKMMWEE